MKTLRPKFILTALLAMALFTTGCMDWWPELGWPAGPDTTWGELNPIQGMHSSPAIKAQEDGMRYPPAATVPVEYRKVRVDLADAGELENPVAVTEASLRYGKLMYDTTCITCHGADGAGEGFIIDDKKYGTQPPSLVNAQARSWSDGHIYHVMTFGKGLMWSYKSQLTEMERWAVVNYIRALQRAEYPEPQDVERVSE